MAACEYLCTPLYVISRYQERSVFISFSSCFLAYTAVTVSFYSFSFSSAFFFLSFHATFLSPSPPLLTFTSGCKTTFEQRRFFLMQIEFFLILTRGRVKSGERGCNMKNLRPGGYVGSRNLMTSWIKGRTKRLRIWLE